MTSADNDLVIGGVSIPKGTRKQIEIPVAKLFDYTEMVIPVEVIRGKEDGPTLFISAAIHGDEINGVETIKRILSRTKTLANIKGTLIAIPIVNVFGFNRNSRYLPDRRDLNRSFPGSDTGSLAGQIAHIFMREIVAKSTHGIDLHTAAIHRNNLSQIRACLDDPKTEDLAHAFGVPVVLNASIRDGSLRQAAADKGIPMLLFEGGEALRYDERVINSAVRGILSVMKSIDMLDGSINIKQRQRDVYISHATYWVRAPHSGSLRARKHLGNRVEKGDLLGVLSNPFGGDKVEVRAPKTGIIIGMTTLPLVNNGDALFHIATFEDSGAVQGRLAEFDEIFEGD